jgi:hypothetical protein
MSYHAAPRATSPRHILTLTLFHYRCVSFMLRLMHNVSGPSSWTRFFGSQRFSSGRVCLAESDYGIGEQILDRGPTERSSLCHYFCALSLALSMMAKRQHSPAACRIIRV